MLRSALFCSASAHTGLWSISSNNIKYSLYGMNYSATSGKILDSMRIWWPQCEAFEISFSFSSQYLEYLTETMFRLGLKRNTGI